MKQFTNSNILHMVCTLCCFTEPAIRLRVLINALRWYIIRSVASIWQGGGKIFFFHIWKYAYREAWLGWFGGMPLREIFLNGAIW